MEDKTKEEGLILFKIAELKKSAGLIEENLSRLVEKVNPILSPDITPTAKEDILEKETPLSAISCKIGSITYSLQCSLEKLCNVIDRAEL